MNSRTGEKGMGYFVTILFLLKKAKVLSGIHLYTWKYNVYIITIEMKVLL